MAKTLKITTAELRTVIGARFRAMAVVAEPCVSGTLTAQFQEPMDFVCVKLINELDSVRILIDQLRLDGEPEVVVVAQPMTAKELRAFFNTLRMQPVDPLLFTDQENAAAVHELFTEHGV